MMKKLLLTTAICLANLFGSAFWAHAENHAEDNTQATAIVTVDFDKIDFWVGEGNSKAALVMRWNDCVDGTSSYICPLDNLVMGVRFADGASVGDVISVAVEGNRRFGNPEAGWYTYDMTGRGKAVTAYDHNKKNASDKVWHSWIISNGEAIASSSDSGVSDGNIVCLEYQPTDAEAPSAVAEAFYIPSDDKLGVFLPERSIFTLRDNCHLFVPFYYNAGQDGAYVAPKVVKDSEEQYKPYVSSAPMLSNASSGNTTLRSHMNFITGKTGSFPLSLTVTIDGTEYNANTDVVIAPPAIAIESLNISPADSIIISGYPNRNVASLSYSFAPENATFTKVAWTSTDAQVATVLNGKVSAGGKQGKCSIRLSSACDSEIYVEVGVEQKLNQLVEEINFGPANGVFDMEYLDIVLIDPVLLPENADNKNFTYEIIGDPEVATTYSTKDIINHKPGSVDVKISTLDGSGITKTVTINFKEPNRNSRSDMYQTGTLWLNEEWFTHTNGSINYITDKDELVYRIYEKQNPYQSFGATSCSAVTFGDRIYVSSKQNQDNGDPRPGGGRLVIFSAKTLRKQAAFDVLDEKGGDGRTVVGINPETVYIGTTGGIKPLFIDNEAETFTLADEYIAGTGGGSLYSGQIGDMLYADGKVYAVKQSLGIIVIDAEKDAVIDTIPESKAVALVQSFDGGVWCASTANLYHIDPKALEFDETYPFPSSFPQSWSAWRPSNLFASKKENVLYWGHSTGWNAGCDWIYRWEIGTNFPTEPIFNSPFPSYPGGTSPNKAYAGGGYDSRTNTLMVASCSGAGTSARYNHINYIDGTTGELLKSIEMKPYFWFPSHLLFPDKYDPMLGISSIELPVDSTSVIDLDDYLVDFDNFKHGIKAELTNISTDSDADAADIAQVSLDGRILTIEPMADGKIELEFTLESNGKRVLKSVPVTITPLASCSDIELAPGNIWHADGQLEIAGYEGYTVTLYNINGIARKRGKAETNACSWPLNLCPGVYVVTAESSRACYTHKIVVR